MGVPKQVQVLCTNNQKPPRQVRPPSCTVGFRKLACKYSDVVTGVYTGHLVMDSHDIFLDVLVACVSAWGHGGWSHICRSCMNAGRNATQLRLHTTLLAQLPAVLPVDVTANVTGSFDH